MIARIKKNDTVLVLSGKDRGKQGLVISMDKRGKAALVKGVGIVTRHVKPKRAGEKGGIVQEERPVLLCKLMPVCGSCKKECRIRIKHTEDAKLRICSRCNETF